MLRKTAWLFFLIIFLAACHQRPWNHPHSQALDDANVYWASFSEQPKTLDPAKAYSSDEMLFIAQIYEPPLQYDYLKRPYTLVPLTATEVPQPVFLDQKGQVLSSKISPQNVAYSVYEIHIKPHVYYQTHPAFVKKTDHRAMVPAENASGDVFERVGARIATGPSRDGGSSSEKTVPERFLAGTANHTDYLYHHLKPEDLKNINTLADFPKAETRELTAEDYVYEIKRLADPHVGSPIFGFLSQYIVGFTEFNRKLAGPRKTWTDLRKEPLAGAEVVDRYTYRILLRGFYPQFPYWLAMPFFAPMPWEVDAFYAQPLLAKKNISLDWFPVGTGPYFLKENNPNRRMVLAKNPNFHGEISPLSQNSLLPYIDQFIFTLEKESLPRWAKFLQGYYDQSAISSDSFQQAIRFNEKGAPTVTAPLKEKNIRLQTTIEPSVMYLGFNMLDPVVGGQNDRAKKLRQAISIAVDYEEYIAIFLNGRGVPAQGPIPPGIFGYRENEEGVNPVVYHWAEAQAKRQSIDIAKQLMIQAGYPEGRDPKTHRSLLLNYDVAGGSGTEDLGYFAWLRKQFAQLGIELNIRETAYNRFQEKIRHGQVQLFSLGWNADYPDPENFLFLFYGPNGKVKFGGENNTNYQNARFDELFVQMRTLPNGPKRQALIDEMVSILQQDAPWAFGFYPKRFVLSQSWVGEFIPNSMANNTLKYLSIDPGLREAKRREWNVSVLWPLIGLVIVGLGIGVWKKWK